MHTLPSQYQAPSAPVITEEMVAALDELLASLPDGEPVPVADQVAVVVQWARFEAEQESQPAVLLRDLVDWLSEKRVDMLCDFLDGRYPMPEITD